ncbi:hypothetical protein AWC38_SpisGene20132 [Stylophora pistillata]|uniref:Uncharacterized protein n=1 Tax=Stylophora pistillata TaxID=50429 RepID=A0A2B4RGP0_STYPI|nr:hypothetical protein AWC38_SpisGene20132 [Stylophora pistillata]
MYLITSSEFDPVYHQLITDDPSATNDPESDEEDDDDERDAIDAELDKPEILEPNEGELFGEELPTTCFAVPNANPSQRPKNKKKFPVPLDPNHPLTRPTTPGAIVTDAVQNNTTRPVTPTIPHNSGEQSRPITSSKSRHGSRTTAN